MRLASSAAISLCIFTPMLVSVPAAQAEEAGPVAGCPSGFFLTVPETSGGEADRNRDGYICVRPGPHGVRVDNTVPVR